jgi:hypothetical protein
MECEAAEKFSPAGRAEIGYNVQQGPVYKGFVRFLGTTWGTTKVQQAESEQAALRGAKSGGRGNVRALRRT